MFERGKLEVNDFCVNLFIVSMNICSAEIICLILLRCFLLSKNIFLIFSKSVVHFNLLFLTCKVLHRWLYHEPWLIGYWLKLPTIVQ